MLEGIICQWILLFQEFDFEVIIKVGNKNVGLNHLSRVLLGESEGNLDGVLPDAHLFQINVVSNQFVDIVAYISTSHALEEYTTCRRNNWLQEFWITD